MSGDEKETTRLFLIITTMTTHVENETGTLLNTIDIGSGATNVAWLGSKEKELLLCSCDDGTLQVSILFNLHKKMYIAHY